jgi:hypothetical protein
MNSHLTTIPSVDLILLFPLCYSRVEYPNL